MAYSFLDNYGTFRLENPEHTSYLYFPIANEDGLKSSVTPLLGGDSKKGQNTFLLQPVSSEELHNNRATRNFWCRISDRNQGHTAIWSATGASAEQEAMRFSKEQEENVLEAGIMWHKITRKSQKYQLKSEILSFVPCKDKDLELMVVTITNQGQKEITVNAIAAIPMFARSADNIRDHRHVTSLLHRIQVEEEGITVEPTLTFDERGHKKNHLVYGVMGYTAEGAKPLQIYPDVETFLGEGGTFTMPRAVIEGYEGCHAGDRIDGFEAMGGLDFGAVCLQPQESKTYMISLGIGETRGELLAAANRYNNIEKATEAFEETKAYWLKDQNVQYQTANPHFDQWMYWVDFQPVLRRIYGCSFLPHHDYGKGGRGWRDLWQDCLALLVMNPDGVRQMLIDNFGGVRFDGSNATIIGSGQGEFIADRNNITRVWMDHGVWPFITTDLYIRQTGDLELLLKEMNYFKDPQIFRGEEKDSSWQEAEGNQLLTADGAVYKGTILEHLLIQHVTSFFDVGEHNEIRLRGADWNDAIDMAADRGESVAFTAAYAGNMGKMAELLVALKERKGVKGVAVAKEVARLLTCNPANYDDVAGKKAMLRSYCQSCSGKISGEKVIVSIDGLIEILRSMSDWMKENIRANEWVGTNVCTNGAEDTQLHWYNGYYDNNGRQVEGAFAIEGESQVRIMLTSQVFSVMSYVATKEQVAEITKAVDKYLYSPEIGGYRLNSNFHELKMDMGRMFGFAYGHKENGAVFCHMAVMYANALYSRGFVKEGYKVISALFNQCNDFEKSCIYPGIPEYFNERGRGMYNYLTGAASWLMLTVLTEIFGVKGLYGDLVLEPKLMAEQFDENGVVKVNCSFGGKKLQVTYLNPEHKEAGSYQIQKLTLNGKGYAFDQEKCMIKAVDLAEQNEITVML